MNQFKFQTTDDVDSLPDKLKEHFPVFLERRITETQGLLDELERGDFEGLGPYCHRNGGIAASYHLNRFSEIVEALRSHSKSEDPNRDSTIELVKNIQSYLNSLK